MRARLMLAAAAFIALGMPRSSLGVAWPAAADEFGRPLADLGLLLAGFVVFYALATMLAGRLVIRFGPGMVIGGAAALGVLSMLIVVTAGDWQWAAFGVGVMGVSGGMIDASVNTEVALHHGARAMGMIHASYGVGATFGPLLVTFGVSRFDQWRPPFAIFAAIHMVIALAFFANNSLWSGSTVARPSPAPVAGRRRVVVLVLLIFSLITAVETTASQFGFSFLTIERGLNETAAGLAVSGFFAGLTIARLGLAVAGHRMKPSLVATGSTLGVVAGAGLMWWSPTALLAAAGLTVIGLAGGTLFPLNVLLTPQRVGTGATPRVVGWQLAAANFGGAAYPPIVGQLIASSGLAVVGPAVMVVAAALLLVAELLRRSSIRVHE